jgi:hypothetical protein
MPPASHTPISPSAMDQSSPKSANTTSPQFSLFKPTGLILERPPSPAEIPKGTIRPLPGHHFVQVQQEPLKIDPLNIKVEKIDPDEPQIINHPSKKSKRKKPSKQLVKDVIMAIKELQAGQSSLPQNHSAAFTENVVQRLPIDRSRSGDVTKPKRRRISPPRSDHHPSPRRPSTATCNRSPRRSPLRRRPPTPPRHHGKSRTGSHSAHRPSGHSRDRHLRRHGSDHRRRSPRPRSYDRHHQII